MSQVKVWFYRNPYGQQASTMGRASHGQDTILGISSVDIHRLVEDVKSTTDTMDEGGVSSHKDKLGVMVVLG